MLLTVDFAYSEVPTVECLLVSARSAYWEPTEKCLEKKCLQLAVENTGRSFQDKEAPSGS